MNNIGEELRRSIRANPVLQLHRATTLIDRVTDRRLQQEHGISLPLFAVLLAVEMHEGATPPSQRELADALDASRASVTQRLAALDGSGLLEVTPDPDDGRRQRVSLTQAGAQLVEVAWQDLTAHDDGIDDGVDLVALGAALERLERNARRALAPSGDAR